MVWRWQVWSVKAQHFNEISYQTSFQKPVAARDKVGETQVTFSSTKTGTTFVMQLVWGAIVWWAGYFTVYVIVGSHCPGLEGYGNPYSSYFVGNPHLWSNAGGVISLVAAFPYLMVFDAVSDTLLLFGYVTPNPKRRNPKPQKAKP